MTLESKHLFIAAAVVAMSAAGLAKAQSTAPAHLPRKGLVAFWSADGHARDSAGKNHGKVGPGVAFTADRHGKAKGAFLFDGKKGVVTIPDSAALDTDDAFTVSLWINPKAYGHPRHLVDKWHDSNIHGDWALTLHPDGQLALHLCSGPARKDILHSKSAVPKNTWTHIAATFDRGAMNLYFNGQFKVAKTSAIVRRTDQAEYKYDDVHIGASYTSSYSLDGAIDDVGVWNRALTADEIRAVFDGLVSNLPHITRVASSDRIELIDRSVLIGKVESESYTITTASVGRIKIPAARVVGLVSGGKKDPRVRLVLSDSQMVVGTMSGQVLQITLSGSSSVLKIPADKILQFGYRISKDRPTAPVASGPMVVLAGGDRLAWTGCKQKLQLATAYGVVDLPIEGVLDIQAVNPADNAYRVVFRNGSTLTGALLGEKLTLKLQLGPTLTCPRGDVRGLVMPARHVKPTGPATVQMRNGDRLFGRIADRTLTIRTEFGELKVRPASMLTMTFDATKPAQVVAKMWGNTTIRGRLAQPTVTVAITPNGPSVKVTAAQIASITSSSAQPPPEILKKIEKRVAQLGAESYLDREKAQEELIAMGKSIVPLLKKYLAETRDPEIRQRLQEIIKALGG